MSRRIRYRWLEAGIGLALATVVVGELVIYSPPVQQTEHALQVAVQPLQTSSNSVDLHFSITHATFQQDLRLVAFQLTSRPVQQLAIYVYTDPGYPSAGVVGTAIQGVFDHLSGELLAHGYGASVLAVTAGQLGDVLHEPNQAAGRAVVMMTGVLPASVFSKQVDLLTPWVEAGGLAVWGGASIGYFSAQKGQALGDTARASFGEKGAELLLGKGMVSFPWRDQRIANVQSDMSAALGITYRLASAGLARNLVLGRGGVALGWSIGPFASLMYLPRGAGGYLLFGGEILDETLVAHDLAQILLSSATNAVGPAMSSQVRLSSSSPSIGFDWSLPFGYSQGGIMLVVFDADPDGTFYFRETLKQNNWRVGH